MVTDTQTDSRIEHDNLRTRNHTLQKRGVWAGIMGPILFTILVIVESLMRPGYSQAYNNISDLGVGPYGIVQNSNFIALGLLLIVFALAIGRSVRIFSTTTIGCLVLSGLGIVTAGISLIVGAYFAHLLATFTAFLGLIAAEFFTWRTTRHDHDVTVGRYRVYSLISGVLSMLFLFIFTYTLSIAYPMGYNASPIYPVGATERLLVAVPLIWMGITGAKIRSNYRTVETRK